MQPTLALLLGVLAAFGVLDAAVLARIHALEQSRIRTDLDLRTTRNQIERLGRIVLLAGAGLGAVFLVGFVILVLTT